VPRRARAFVADLWAGYAINMFEFEFPTGTGGQYSYGLLYLKPDLLSQFRDLGSVLMYGDAAL
jgi:hypothetical protein